MSQKSGRKRLIKTIKKPRPKPPAVAKSALKGE